jgi:hypothetical protein
VISTGVAGGFERLVIAKFEITSRYVNAHPSGHVISAFDHLVGTREQRRRHVETDWDGFAERNLWNIERGRLVALVRELHGQGQSLRQISKTLAAQGHLTGGGRPYTATAVQKILRGG